MYGRSPGRRVSVSTSPHHQFPRHGVRVLPQRVDGLDGLLLGARGSGEAGDDQNQFGGNIGGPIRQGQRVLLRGTTRGPGSPAASRRLTRVPTADERPDLHVTVRDPTTGQPFANNRIPSERIDPYTAAIIALVPLPNQPGANNFFRTADLVDDADRLMGRVDWRPNATDGIFAATCTRTARARFRAPSAAWSTAPAPRPSGIRRSRPTPSWAGGRESSRRPSSTSSGSPGHAPTRTPFTRRSASRRRRRRRSPGRLPIRPWPAASGHHDRRLLRRVGARPHRIARLPAEVPAHGPVRVHQQPLLVVGGPCTQVRVPTSSRR